VAMIQREGLTIADLEAMPDDGRRYELLGGSIVVNASPAPRHQRALLRLSQLLLPGVPAGHELFVAPMDLDLVGEQRVEPDLVVVPAASVGEQRLSLPVLLVVELVSPSTAHWDLVAKREAYADAGIEHYWLLDTRPGVARFIALRLDSDAGTYVTVEESAEHIHADEPVAVSAPLPELFDPPA